MANSLRGKLVSDIVPGQENSIRLNTIDLLDRMPQQKWLSKFVEVDIAQLGDSHSIESSGQRLKTNFERLDFDPMALDLSRIKSQARAPAKSCREEAAPADGFELNESGDDAWDSAVLRFKPVLLLLNME